MIITSSSEESFFSASSSCVFLITLTDKGILGGKLKLGLISGAGFFLIAADF